MPARVAAQCGQIVETHTTLAADLDCTASLQPAIVLRPGATLDLAGFTVTGGGGDAVVCEGSCAIDGGGGRITGAASCAIFLLGATLAANDLTADYNGYGICGVVGDDAYDLHGKVELDGVALDHDEIGIIAKQVRARASSFNDNDTYGIFALRRVELTDSFVRNNGVWGMTGLQHARISVERSDVSANAAYGIMEAKSVRLADSTVSSNGYLGVQARRVRAQGSTLVSNSMSPDCGTTVVCADIVSRAKPKLLTSSCEQSSAFVTHRGDYVSGWPGELVPWGVCSLD